MRPFAWLVACATLIIGATGGLAETQIERGGYLVRAVAACGNCHSPLGPDGPIPGQELSGRFVIKTPAFEAWAPNITPAAIGDWTDDQIGRLIREGVRPDGRVIGPPMPIELYREISEEDLAAMIAYLRSVPPVENTVPRSQYFIPLPESYGPPVADVTAPPPGETAEYGAYLAGPVAHCTECHTPMVNGHIDFANQHGAGGRVFDGPWGVTVSANLTSDPDALARWTDDEVIAMIRTGQRPDGSPMAPPMGYPFYAEMTDRDARAIVAFLRTLPPKKTP